MIESPPDDPSLQEATEWTVRALQDEDLPVLLCGRGAVDYQGEYTGSVDIDVLIGADFRGALFVLDAYADRGDLSQIMAEPGAVVRFLVAGKTPIDLIDVSAIHQELFRLLTFKASVIINLSDDTEVRAVTREGYFVLAVMIGRRGFARDKEAPMEKVRESWEMFGQRTDAAAVDRMLVELGEEGALEDALS